MPSAHTLLPRALAWAEALPEPDARRRAVLQISVLAAQLNEPLHAGAAALALDAPWAQVQERALRLQRRLDAPSADPAALRAQSVALSSALDALSGSASWRPAALTHPDEARVPLAEAWARLAEHALCDATLGEITAGAPRALAWAAASAGAWASAPERAAAMAHHALTLAAAEADPPLLRRALTKVVDGALAVARPGAAITALNELRSFGLTGQRWAAAALLVAERCAVAGELRVAGATYQRAGQAIEEEPGDDLGAAALLLGLADGQRRHLGPTLARTTIGRLLDRLHGQLLGPEPNHRLPFRPLLQASLRDPALATPLRDLLRAQTVVAPGWCYALGRLELATGHPERARQAARVLEESADLGANDVEARWMAALLRAELGDGRRARRLMLAALPELPADASLELPGAPEGSGRADRIFADALLACGDAEGALLLARLTVAPADRAESLRRCALRAAVAEGTRAARAALDEAKAALGELEPPARDPALAFALAAAYQTIGDIDAAVELFEVEWARLRAEPTAAAALELVATTLWPRATPALAAAIDAAYRDAEALAAADPDRLALALAWLQAEAATLRLSAPAERP